MISTQPYGTWPSPLGAADLAEGAVAPSDLLVAEDQIVWIESRPWQSGRQALVCFDGHGVVDLSPSHFDARSRVHEYGGAPFVLVGGRVLASSFADQRLHWVTPERTEPLTEEPDSRPSTRWADAVPTADQRSIVAVREFHGDGEPRNEIVRVDVASGRQRVLVSGRDFVSAPRLSPDGSRLAWLAWDHPFMPWDAAELWVGELTDEGVSDAVHVAGREGASACVPVWLPDGRLAYAEDATGFWEAHVLEGATVRRVSDFRADCGGPIWTFGSRAIAPMPDGRLACAVTERATQRLYLLDVDTGQHVGVSLPYSYVDRLQAFGDGLAFIAAETGGARAVVVWRPEHGATELRRYDIPRLREGDRPVPEPIEVETPDDARTHAFLYRPANADVAGPDDERPPLVVFTHGGPTGNVFPVLTPSIAYWTTRGFAVVDVNYRGSTGFGRAYRDALLGRWGELDVIDTIAVARGLADLGVVDGTRMAIRGGSAGGYTTLAVLTTPDHPFACGTSFFGVADLELLAAHTHKFESRYLDRVVGPLPESRDLYVARSPLHRADLLSRPLLVLQGLEDAVVPPEQAEAMVAAAAERGIPHAYIPFDGEQHGFRRAENIITWLESELAFYGQVMGFVPAGDLPGLELRTAAS